MSGPDVTARLNGLGFEVVAGGQLPRHVLVTRDGFAALVERREASYGKAGSAGLLTGHGFATLFWRGGQAFFVARGFERPALPEEVDRLRAFAAELDAALASGA